MKMRSKSFPVSSCRRKSLEPYQSRNPITNFEVVQKSVVSDSVSDKCVSNCSGIDCFLSFHQECLDAELDSSSEEEGLANPYCPYCCCFKTLALREYASLSGDDYDGYSDSETDTGKLSVRDEVEASDDETRVNTCLSGNDDDDDDNGYSTEIISDQEELQGDKDDACSSKDTSLSGHDDGNGCSVATTEIVSDQQGDEDDACSSKALLDNDSEKSNMTLAEEQVIDEVEETTEIISDQGLQGDKDSDKSNMPLVEETDPEEYNSGNRRRITLKAIDSEISSSIKLTGEDVTQVAKSMTVRDISSSSKDQRRRVLWTSKEEEMLKDERFGPGVSTTDCDSDVENVVPVTSFDTRNVPHKKRHYLVTASGGSEMLHKSVPNKCVSGIFGLGCLVSFREQSLNAELGSSNSSEEEDPAHSYCPYCWFHILAVREKAVVGLEIADFEYTNFSCDDDNEYSLDTTEIVSDQEVQGDNDDACSSKGEQVHVDKDTSDDNGYSVDTTEIVSGQELQGDEDDACSSTWEQVQVDKDSDQSNITLVEETDPEEEQVIDEVEALDDETAQDKASVNAAVYGDENGYSVDTTEIISDQESQGDKDDACSSKGEQVQVNNDSDRSNMPLVEETDSEEYYSETLQVIDEVESSDDETGQDQTRVNRCAAGERDGSGKENDQVQPNENRRQRRRIKRRIALEAIDSEVSSNESTTEPTGADEVTQVPKSKTVRDISFFNKNQRRRILWTSEEEEMLTVGVEKFAAEVKLNMPWRKILEMGKNVFHETRTPDNLKDKWRNMIRAR